MPGKYISQLFKAIETERVKHVRRQIDLFGCFSRKFQETEFYFPNSELNELLLVLRQSYLNVFRILNDIFATSKTKLISFPVPRNFELTLQFSEEKCRFSWN